MKNWVLVVIGRSNNRSFGYTIRKEAVMAKYLIGLLMAAIMAVILGISTSAWAGPCERRCKTSSVTDDELKDCLSKCKPQRKKRIGGGGKVEMVTCASLNGGEGGEIKSGEECLPCSELDPDAVEVETDDGKAYCAKHCAFHRKPIPLAKWEENCPTCESKGLVTSDDGKSCIKKTVQYVPAEPVPTDVCKDCKPCSFYCLTLWDIILFIILMLFVAYYLFFDRGGRRKFLENLDERNKKHLENVDANFREFRNKTKQMLGNAISGTELGFILAAQRELIKLRENYIRLEAAKNEVASKKVAIEDELGNLDQERPQLEWVLEDARRTFGVAEAKGPKQVGMTDIAAIKKERGLRSVDEAMEVATELQAEYNASFETELEIQKKSIADAEAALKANAEAKAALEAELEQAQSDFDTANIAFENAQARIVAIEERYPQLVDSNSDSDSGPTPPPVPAS